MKFNGASRGRSIFTVRIGVATVLPGLSRSPLVVSRRNTWEKNTYFSSKLSGVTQWQVKALGLESFCPINKFNPETFSNLLWIGHHGQSVPYPLQFLLKAERPIWGHLAARPRGLGGIQWDESQTVSVPPKTIFASWPFQGVCCLFQGGQGARRTLYGWVHTHEPSLMRHRRWSLGHGFGSSRSPTWHAS